MSDRVADQLRVKDRLRHLASLRNGWLDGEGLAPTAAAISTARSIAVAMTFAGYKPSICPTEDGGVSLEWDRPDSIVEIVIGPDGVGIDFDSVEIESPLLAVAR